MFSPFSLEIIISLQESGSTLSIHHSPQKKTKKKKNDRYSTTEIFIFSPPLFFSFFCFLPGNKIYFRADRGERWKELERKGWKCE